MDNALQAVLFLASMAVSAIIIIPLFIKLGKAMRRRRESFAKFAEEHGGKVIARYVPKSYSSFHEGNGKYSHESSKYYYYGPDNKKYTKTFVHRTIRSQEIEIYVDPRNPKKVWTHYEITHGKLDRFLLVLMWPLTLIAGWKLFNLLCAVFG